MRAVESRDGECDRVVAGEHDHHQDLATEKFGQHGVDVAGDRARLRTPAARQQVVESQEDHLPVAQQVEHHDRYQRQVDDKRQQDQAAGLDARRAASATTSRAARVLRQEFAHRGEVERQLEAEVLLDPRHDVLGQLLQQIGTRRAARTASDWISGTSTKNSAASTTPNQQHDERAWTARAARHAPQRGRRSACRGTRG